MGLYRTKSNYIEAIKFTRSNFNEVIDFTNGKAKHLFISLDGYASCELECSTRVLRVMENRYIVKISNNNFYICDEESFESLYKRIND